MINKISKGIYIWNGLERCKEFLEEIPVFRDVDSSFKNDHSLASVNYCFLSLLKTFKNISQEKLVFTLSKNSKKSKSKNRKIFEICKILSALGICTLETRKKKTFLIWKGKEEFLKEIETIIKSEKIDYKSLKNNSKFQKHQSTLINNLTKLFAKTDIFKTNEEIFLTKRRTSSFDASIVEKYLVKDNNLILPKVNLPLLEEE